MLRFATKPDPVFLAIMHDALEDRREDVRGYLEDGVDERDWREGLPAVAGLFAPQAAIEQIGRVLAASRDVRLYQVTDYHWLIVYDALRAFCEVHNDAIRGEKSGTRPVGPYEVGRIDFGAVVDEFFWDTDFLIGSDLLELTREQRRRQLGVSDEAFGIAAGLAPHPDELRIVPWDEDPGWYEGDEAAPEELVVPTYPREPREEQEPPPLHGL